jgi:uncharacterized zinc-type alcohol dehydrogenase-like protein
MVRSIGWAAQDATSPLAPFSFERREPGARDVAIDILFCGVCHSDIHTARNEWHNTIYPCVTGHEIVGRVAAVGVGVTRFAVGDRVGVGCLVDSCRKCDSCQEGLEQYCTGGATGTYNTKNRETGEVTYGGYSSSIVVDEDFVLRIPDSLDLAAAAPLLCAGITTYSPLRHFGAGPGRRVGVAGIGGLGHMAVQFAATLGAEVVALTTNEQKAKDALRLGATEAVVVSDSDAMQSLARSLDIIISTLPSTHSVKPYLRLLRRDGAYVIVGALEPLTEPVPANLLAGRRLHLTGSGIGGIAETQEMLDFCAEKGITAEIETVSIQDINEVFDRTVAGEPRYRYVIDMATLS